MIANAVLRAAFLRDIDHAHRLDARIFPPLAKEVVHILARLVEFLRADNEIDIGQFIQNRRAPALRHATEEADDLMLAMLFAPFQCSHFADGLLFRHVANRAGIQQDHIGAFLATFSITYLSTVGATNYATYKSTFVTAISFSISTAHTSTYLTT